MRDEQSTTNDPRAGVRETASLDGYISFVLYDTTGCLVARIEVMQVEYEQNPEAWVTPLKRWHWRHGGVDDDEKPDPTLSLVRD